MQHSAPSVGDGGGLAAVRTPRGFKAVEGVREAWVAATGPFSRTPAGRTAAQRAGLRYERKVHGYLEDTFPGLYMASQWFQYRDACGALRWCQPDGLLRLGNVVVIFEVKARFGSDGWWQLRRLYSSVVTAAWRPSILGLCLVCRNYDPFVPFPEGHDVVDDVERWVIRRQFAQVGVLPWKG